MKLDTSKRKKLAKSVFGLPGSRSYPVNDRKHAILAKGRAKEEMNKDKLSKSSEEKIVAKANRKLGK